MKEDAVFKSISDVAASLNVPASALRFWETQFVQIKPVRRVGGRRYYRSEDVRLFQQIYDLLYKQGYTISGAQKYLKENAYKEQNKSVNLDKKQAFIDKMVSVRDYLKDFIS